MSRRLILGTAGHIDHGKTTLVRALTGTDTDRLAEEKRRGITIELGFAELPLDEDLTLGVVDVPGHEGFVRQMLAGATGIDLVMLVVAADEGVMPQTREHLAIVELLGVRGGVVAVTKSDVVEPAWLELVLDELREQLAGTAFAGAELVPVSGRTGAGLDALRAALRGAASTVPDRATDDLFRLPVDRSFTVRGTGTVVTGTVWTGGVDADATLRLLPQGREVRVRGIQVHGRDRTRASAGERAALALAGVERDEAGRGSVLVQGGGWRAARMLTGRVRVLPGTGWTLRRRQRVRVHLGTAEALARVALLDAAELEPGDEGWAQLRLESPLVARAGDRFVIRSYSPVTTIAGGVVAEPQPPKRKRLDAGVEARLAALLAGDASAAVAALAGLAGWEGVARGALPVLVPGTVTEESIAAAGVEAGGDRLFAADVADAARGRVLAGALDYLRQWPLQPAAPWDVLRRALPERAPATLTERAIAGLRETGALEARDEGLAPPDHTPSPSPDQEAACRRLLDMLEAAGLAPPAPADLPAALRDRADLAELIGLLQRRGRLTRVGPELLFHTETLERAVARIREELGGREDVTPADVRALFPELTRKYLIPLLEHLDVRGVTRRVGEARSVARGAAPEGAAP